MTTFVLVSSPPGAPGPLAERSVVAA